jgi:formate dehydrogenase subunit gamma
LDDSIAIAPDQLVQRHAQPGVSLLAVLHAIQDEVGYVPPAAVAPLARAMNLSRAEVHGVITYYHHFRATPAAGKVVQICRAESCKAMGADALLAHAQQHLGCAVHGHSADGAFTLEPVYCLGLCAQSPAIMLGDELHACVTPQRFDELIAEAKGTP